jgi:redox-sensitive bicupin YhaK (pirin superfamily)
MTGVELKVGPRLRDLVGFRINRVWPTARRRLVGPFIFYDHMLRCELSPGRGLDVPPHPHIGIATVTYLFEGALVHRDSLGTEQEILPGDLNWMVAGRGITHSERSSEAERARSSVLHGTQAWVALPREHEGCAPEFTHVAAADIPEHESNGVRLRMLVGSGFGLDSPLQANTPMHYAEARMEAGSTLSLTADLGQRAAYIVSGDISCADNTYQAGRLLVFSDTMDIALTALTQSHLMLLGGSRLSEDRHIWWNFVATTGAAIEAARRRWAAGEFPAVPGDAGRMEMPKS